MYLLYTMYFGLLLLIELEIVLSVRRWNILGLQTASIYAWIRLPGGRTLSMLGLPRPPPWISDSNHVVLWSRERDGGWPFLTSFTMKQSSSQPVNCQALTALWGVHKLRWQDFFFNIFDQLSTPCWHLWWNSFTAIKENLHTVDVSSTTYLPRLVNVVCECPLHRLGSSRSM